jgi:hypothetical protein
VDELISRILIGGFLLAIALLGVYYWWRARTQPHMLPSDSKAREKLRERLGKADVLNAFVTPDDEHEVLTNWLAERRRIQATALNAFLCGALCGGLIAGAFLSLGVPMFWAVWPVLITTLTGSIGGVALSLAHVESRPIVQTGGEESPPVAMFRPRFALIVGCVTVAYCALISLLVALRMVPLGPSYDDTHHIAPLLKSPMLILIAPLAALALLVLVEVGIRLILTTSQILFAHDAELQRRARRQWLGERVGVFVMMEAGLLPLFVAVYIGDLARPFAFPLPGTVGGIALVFAMLSMPWGFAAGLRFIA